MSLDFSKYLNSGAGIFFIKQAFRRVSIFNWDVKNKQFVFTYKCIPPFPGIYAVVANPLFIERDCDLDIQVKNIVYIGCSANMKTRWQCHQKKDLLEDYLKITSNLINDVTAPIQLYCWSNPFMSIKDIQRLEKNLITGIQPYLNSNFTHHLKNQKKESMNTPNKAECPYCESVNTSPSILKNDEMLRYFCFNCQQYFYDFYINEITKSKLDNIKDRLNCQTEPETVNKILKLAKLLME